MFSAIHRWLKQRKRPTTRLDEAQVLQIARTAAAGQPDSELLQLVSLATGSERPTWLVSSATVGSALVVSIDDETAEVLAIERHGLR